ncbi:unnamed protein product [Paramecium primaurelia]|uniref:Uncharacterized protein n=1 Tax=Paramecium primaurelia TaxID=5886 RepID=A0A8S1QVG6_PARPR|nr:unnamed protein product [Paramecium primaurelia]
MEIHQLLVVMISLSVYGMSKQDNKKSDQIVVLVGSNQSVSLLMVKDQLLNGQEIKSSDKKYKDIIKQFKIQLQQNSHFSEISRYQNSLLISKMAIFQIKGALILKGEFSNQSGIDLKTIFKQKGSCFLEDLQQK